MIGDQLLQHLGIGGIAALGFLFGGQLQLAKKNISQLLGGIDIEFAAGQLIDLLLQLDGQSIQVDAKLPQALAVDAKAGELHRGQHLAEGLLHLPQQLLLAVRFQLPLQQGRKRRKAQAFPCQRQQLLRGLRRGEGKPMLGQLAFHGVVTGIGIEQIPGQTGIQP